MSGFPAPLDESPPDSTYTNQSPREASRHIGTYGDFNVVNEIILVRVQIRVTAVEAGWIFGSFRGFKRLFDMSS